MPARAPERRAVLKEVVVGVDIVGIGCGRGGEEGI